MRGGVNLPKKFLEDGKKRKEKYLQRESICGVQ